MGCERGIYRQDCFNGVVQYLMYDSNCCLRAKAEVLLADADAETEDAMAAWLDLRDPVVPEGFTSTSDSPLPELGSLAA
jgi:hypothetical protein